jgi:uncharacterized membrane protein YkoI
MAMAAAGLLFSASVQPASASGTAGARAAGAPWRLAADNGVSLEAAIRQVRQRFGDVTILKAETKGKNGRRVHRIKFLTDGGRVRTVRIDAQTGEFR